MSVCEVPFAKRNFLQNHEHRGQIRMLVPKFHQTHGNYCTTPRSEHTGNTHLKSSGTEQSSNASVETEPSLAPQSLNKYASPMTCFLAKEQQEWLDLLHARSEIHLGDQVKTAAWLERVLTFNAEAKPACAASSSDPPFIGPLDPARERISRKCPSRSEEAGICALLTVGGGRGIIQLSEFKEVGIKYAAAAKSLAPIVSLALVHRIWWNLPSFLLFITYSETVEAIASRSTQECARAASELEEVIAFMYDFENDQVSRSQSKTEPSGHQDDASMP